MHPTLRALLLVMAAPDSALAAGLGGYTRTFVRWHLWAAVRRGLAPRGEPVAGGPFKEFVSRLLCLHAAMRITVVPHLPAPWVYVSANWLGKGSAPGLCAFGADGRRAWTYDLLALVPRRPAIVVDLSHAPEAGVTFLAVTWPDADGRRSVTIAELSLSSGDPWVACVRAQDWEPPPGEDIRAVRASPCGRRLYTLLSLSRPTARVAVLAADGLAMLRSWPAPQARRLAVTGAEHLALYMQRDGGDTVEIFTPDGIRLWGWETPCLTFGPYLLAWDPGAEELIVPGNMADSPSSSDEVVLAWR
jgi:hypothetical protein